MARKLQLVCTMHPDILYRRGKLRAGFSLIELLIVVAIILVIAAIAIPNLLRSRIAANEASAAASVRSIATAQLAYNAAYPTNGYATALTNLGGPAAGCTPSAVTACIVDNTLSSGVKSGYNFLSAGFAAGGGTNVTFVGSSAPVSFNLTGVRDFCIVTDAVLRSNPGVAGGVPAPDVPTCQAYATAQ